MTPLVKTDKALQRFAHSWRRYYKFMMQYLVYDRPPKQYHDMKNAQTLRRQHRRLASE